MHQPATLILPLSLSLRIFLRLSRYLSLSLSPSLCLSLSLSPPLSLSLSLTPPTPPTAQLFPLSGQKGAMGGELDKLVKVFPNPGTGTAYPPTVLPTVGPYALPVPGFVPGSG